MVHVPRLRLVAALLAAPRLAEARPGYVGGQHVNLDAFAALNGGGTIAAGRA